VAKLVAEIDRLLRGGHTQREDLAAGRVGIDARSLAVAGAVLSGSYGLFMGLYAVMRGGPGAALQIASTAVKVPLLFLLTLAVTFPSLYVFSALAQSPLSLVSTLRLLLAAVTVNVALLASFGPITGFFTLSTESYSFMVVLNVVFFALAGAVGLSFLERALKGFFGTPAGSTGPQTLGPIVRGPGTDNPARTVFRIWTLIFAVVGAQMGWVLRPFIGAPNAPFQWFRNRQSNFFVAFVEALGRLFS
jgi:hypothetical protein